MKYLTALLTGLLASLLAMPAATSADAPAQPSTGSQVTRVVAVGDIACAPGTSGGDGRCRDAEVAGLTGSLDPDRVLLLGDIQYESGSLTDFRAGFATHWSEFASIWEPIPGNHEYRTADAGGYREFFGVSGRLYRRIDLGSWSAYLLDSNCDLIDCDREATWLRRQLRRDRASCSLIAWHHPRFSSGQEHGSDLTMRRFWRIADRHGVELALAGHDHDYERFRPMAADGARDPQGMISFVAGAGGKSLYRRGETVPGSAYFRLL